MTSLRAGLARVDITVFEPEMALFGWGDDRNLPSGVTLPLHARALVLEQADTGKRVALVIAELGMVSESVRAAVVSKLARLPLKLDGDAVLLAATHTHSGPSGYSTYLLPSLAGPGFSQRIHDAIVERLVAALSQACARLEGARMWLHEQVIPISEPIAFNRSVAAYNRNVDVTPVSPERSDEAVDRRMRVLRIDAIDGRPLGLLSWFGVHGTSVHADHRAIHADNKGYAASLVERALAERGASEFVAAFAQAPAGDVTPNYRMCPRRKILVGRYDDDDESARFHGAIQARHAHAVWARAPEHGVELHGPLAAVFEPADMFASRAEPRFHDRPLEPAISTQPAMLGLPFTFGTEEGPGPLRRLQPSMSAILATHRLARTVIGPRLGDRVPLLSLADPADRSLAYRTGAALALPFVPTRARPHYRRALESGGEWVPRHVPFQLVRIGTLTIAGFAPEATTVAGRRIERALLERDPTARVIAMPYANAYCGYLATPEEYDAHSYEGAVTLYGRASLAAVITRLVELHQQIEGPP
jgi:neutral ceramidase